MTLYLKTKELIQCIQAHPIGNVFLSSLWVDQKEGDVSLSNINNLLKEEMNVIQVYNLVNSMLMTLERRIGTISIDNTLSVRIKTFLIEMKEVIHDDYKNECERILEETNEKIYLLGRDTNKLIDVVPPRVIFEPSQPKINFLDLVHDIQLIMNQSNITNERFEVLCSKTDCTREELMEIITFIVEELPVLLKNEGKPHVVKFLEVFHIPSFKCLKTTF